MAKKKKCDACKGGGLCRVCKGTGKKGSWVTTRCSACNSSGNCNPCGGSGYR